MGDAKHSKFNTLEKEIKLQKLANQGQECVYIYIFIYLFF